MPLSIPKSMMIQSSGRSLSIDFFSDGEVQQIFTEVSKKLMLTGGGLADINGITSWSNFYTGQEEGQMRF